MNRLPPSVTNIVAPKGWSPSQLVLGVDCRLRAVFAASDSVPRLLTHPRAAVGSVMHKLLENAAKGMIRRESDLHDAVEAEFHRLLSAKERTLGLDAGTAHFGKLSQSFSEVDWHNHVHTHLSVAVSLLRHAPAFREPVSSAPRPKRTFDDLDRAGSWSEVSIQSDSLRLIGRMDNVELSSDGAVHIRDYKGGRILDRDGSVLHPIQLQLRLYGLAVLSERPHSRISLSVSNGRQDFAVTFADSDIDETRAWLDDFLSALPPGDQLTSEHHSTLSTTCSQCDHRHICPGYRKAAPQKWVDGTRDGAQALDTWGEVAASESSGGLTCLDILSASSRRVRVRRLDTARHHLEHVEIGQYIWLFGLASSRKRIVGGRFVQPRNFYEIPAAASEKRAWSLCVFEN